MKKIALIIMGLLILTIISGVRASSDAIQLMNCSPAMKNKVDLDLNHILNNKDVTRAERIVYNHLGDLSGNGIIDDNDTQLLMDCLVGRIHGSICKKGDLDMNGILDVADVVYLNNIKLGKKLDINLDHRLNSKDIEAVKEIVTKCGSHNVTPTNQTNETLSINHTHHNPINETLPIPHHNPPNGYAYGIGRYSEYGLMFDLVSRGGLVHRTRDGFYTRSGNLRINSLLKNINIEKANWKVEVYRGEELVMSKEQPLQCSRAWCGGNVQLSLSNGAYLVVLTYHKTINNKGVMGEDTIRRTFNLYVNTEGMIYREKSCNAHINNSWLATLPPGRYSVKISNYDAAAGTKLFLIVNNKKYFLGEYAGSEDNVIDNYRQPLIINLGEKANIDLKGEAIWHNNVYLVDSYAHTNMCRVETSLNGVRLYCEDPASFDCDKKDFVVDIERSNTSGLRVGLDPMISDVFAQRNGSTMNIKLVFDLPQPIDSAMIEIIDRDNGKVVYNGMATISIVGNKGYTIIPLNINMGA